LTDQNKAARLQHALSKIDLSSTTTTTTTATRSATPTPKFLPLFDEVHVDEKWFCLCCNGENYTIVYGEEEPPKRHISHKSHITKVMFLCAQARPRRLSDNTWWDGKIIFRLASGPLVSTLLHKEPVLTDQQAPTSLQSSLLTEISTER